MSKLPFGRRLDLIPIGDERFCLDRMLISLQQLDHGAQSLVDFGCHVLFVVLSLIFLPRRPRYADFNLDPISLAFCRLRADDPEGFCIAMNLAIYS
jgi:hypothetical protein